MPRPAVVARRNHADPAADVARSAVRRARPQPVSHVRSARHLLSAGPAVGGSIPCMSALRVLILGGYGTFGGRLAQLLADEPRLTLSIAGRTRDKAEAFCARLRAAAQLEALAFDRNGDVERALADAKLDVVVDASGPFQNSAGDPYRLVRACLALGIDYLDLADGSEFVDGIAQFDAAAQARGVAMLSGVSSFPVLTAAVVRRLAHGTLPEMARDRKSVV